MVATVSKTRCTADQNLSIIRDMDLRLILELISRADGEWRDSFVE